MIDSKRQAEVLGDLGNVSRHPEVTRAQSYIREQGEEIAALRKQAAEQEAQVAAYRQALGTILDMPAGGGIGDHDDCSCCERRDEVAGAVWRSTTAGQPLLDRQRELEEALIETSAHADWLWMELRSARAPERFWKAQPHSVRDGYRLAARNKLVEKGLVK